MDMRITAKLDTPTIGRIGPLDGPLAWAWIQRAIQAGKPIPQMADDYAFDAPLPLATWHRDGYWGWCVSEPHLNPVHHSATEIRRKPATQPMALYSNAREHHHGLGPMKARNTIVPTTYHHTISWDAAVTNETELRNLLGLITHLGARHRNGYGHITHWHIKPGAPGGWQARKFPAEVGPVERVRAPYWHPTERTRCA